ncbi:MAG: alcohol dehydrogenase catalytic domain-containing protein [Bacillota bacterium]
MRRLVLLRPYEAVIQEVPVPEPGPGEALVKVRSVGVCGTDVRAWQGLHSFSSYPRVPGHEIAGEVVRLGQGAEGCGVMPGDRVVVEPMVACGKCYPCSLGRYNCCERLEVLGVHRDGAMQEFISVPCSLLHKAPAGLGFTMLSLVEPACVAMHAVRRSRIKPGDVAVVIGAGNIGLLIIQMLKLSGARVIAIDVRRSHLDAASRLGADLVIDSRLEDPVKGTHKFSNGAGGSVVFEVVGIALTVCLAFDLSSHAGQVVLVGLCHEEIPFRFDLLNRKELDVLGSRNSCGLFPEVLGLLAGSRLVAELLVTQHIRLEDFEATMRSLTTGGRDEIKVVMEL